MPSATKDLYLTFDDGPVPGPTEFVLDVLARFNIKATFFCIGDNIRKHPDLFGRVLESGHVVGNHTFHHVSGWKTPAIEYVEEVNLCEEEIAKYSGAIQDASERRLFRPPYGRITRAQIGLLRNTYQIVMWDVLSVDYNRRLSKEACLKNTLRAIRPGSIIVFHDSQKAEVNLTYALPRFIEQSLELGYAFKPVTCP